MRRAARGTAPVSDRNFDNALMMELTHRLIPIVREALRSHPASHVIVSLAAACCGALGAVSRPPARNAALGAFGEFARFWAERAKGIDGESGR